MTPSSYRCPKRRRWPKFRRGRWTPYASKPGRCWPPLADPGLGRPPRAGATGRGRYGPPSANRWRTHMTAGRFYNKRSNCTRAAHAFLGDAKAQEGVAFVITEPAPGQWAWALPQQELPDFLRRQPGEQAAAPTVPPRSMPAAVAPDTKRMSPASGRRRAHAADVADLAKLATATGFVTTLFHDGAFDKRTSDNLMAARALGRAMAAEFPRLARKPMVYALLPDGGQVFVPNDYTPEYI